MNLREKVRLTRAGGGHNSDGLGGAGRSGNGGSRSGAGGGGSGSRGGRGAGGARGRPMLTPALRRVGSNSVLGNGVDGLLAASLNDTGKGRAGGQSQKSNRLEHFEKLKDVLGKKT